MWFLNSNDFIWREKGKTGKDDKALSEQEETAGSSSALDFLPLWS